MEATYRRNLHKSYMCIQEQGKVEEKYELRMLEKVRVPYLLKMEIIVAEGERQYLYDISGKQQLDDYLSGKKMGYDMLWRVLYSIRELCFVLPDYLLRESGICLGPEYVYINLEDKGVYFTYLPCWNQNLPEAFEHYMEQILRKIDHQDLAATELGYQVYQRCMVKNADIQGILEHVIIKEKWNRPEKEVTQKLDAEPAKFCCETIQEKSGEEPLEKNEEVKKDYFDFSKFWAEKAPWFSRFLFCLKEKNINEKVLEKKGSEKKQLSFLFRKGLAVKEKFLRGQKEKKKIQSEKRLRREEGKKEKDTKKRSWKEMNLSEWEKKELAVEKEPAHPTEILGVCSQEPKGKLMYQGIHNCEDIWVEGEEFLLGKNRQQAMGIIEAEGISRLHAKISRKEGIYYLEDLNSTNGTYLNGEPVEYHQKRKLCKGDCIKFGAEEFLFF